MVHLGDITKINGAAIEPVWCVTGGSPCQDLSIAGKRAGLAGARSGLFMEQIRVVKEIREHDKQLGRTGEFVRPRYMVWENVPGALSSNKGRDFAAVLEETIRIVEPEAPGVEVPAKGWPTWGGYRDVDGRWSVAWRVHDAQYWGVPQRRRRIALVADFGGDTAHEILFERAGMSGNLEPRGETRERPAGEAEAGASYAVRIRGGCDGGGKGALIQTEKSGTLGTGNDQTIFQGAAYGICSYASNSMMSGNPHSGIYEADTSRTLDLNGGNPACNQGGIAVVQSAYQMQGFGDYRQADVSSSCKQRDYKDSTDLVVTENVSPTLRANPADPYRADMAAYVAQPRNTYSQSGVVCMTPWDSQTARVYSSEGVFHSLNANESGGQSRDSVFCNMVVRRLTPLECERLQGFPLCWENVHGAGTAKWASEIEEFPIAVTKLRFGCLQSGVQS